MSRAAGAALAAALALAFALAGCGARAPDLFEVHRTGSGPNANLTMIVSDGGNVTCNGRQHELPPKRLLDARALTRDLGKQAQLALDLPPRPGSVLSYKVRMEAGSIAFADTSRPLPTSLARLEAFTSDVARNVCGLGA